MLRTLYLGHTKEGQSIGVTFHQPVKVFLIRSQVSVAHAYNKRILCVWVVGMTNVKCANVTVRERNKVPNIAPLLTLIPGELFLDCLCHYKFEDPRKRQISILIVALFIKQNGG